jgi:surface antigen
MLKIETVSVLVALALAAGITTNAKALDLTQGFSGGNVGEVGGGVIGGVGGNYLAKKGKLGKTGQLAATIGGTLVGGMLGGSLGKQLDAPSRARAQTAQLTAVSTGTRQSWQSPYHAGAGAAAGAWGSARGTGVSRTAASAGESSGWVEPGNPYQTQNGMCRDYTHTIVVGGRKETARGIACRNPDGSWRIAS